jgi:2-dehydro-3-deoxyphosphogluconate aldolase/(4S)-4-hydroxy-2-oxoglutarate aldolase
MSAILDHIYEAKIVAIFRGDYQGQWISYADALLGGGVSLMEVTLNSAGALDGIAQLKAHYGDRIALGAGTVLTADEAHAAIDAGASFLVAPDTDEEVIAVAKERSVVVIPGAYTPTEIKRAYKLGADMVKVFPSLSADYLKAVRAPLDHIPLLATGGVSLENAAEFIKAGAVALGIGSYLTKPSMTPDEVAARAAKFVAAVAGKQLA